MNTVTRISALGSAALGALLAGSSSFAGDPGAALVAAPAEAAIAAYFQTGQQTKLSAQSAPTPKNPGDQYTLAVEVAPNAGSTSFRDQTSVYSSVVTASLEKNGAALSSTSSTVYYRLRPFGLLGKLVGKGTPYGVVKSFYALPATAPVGSTGPFNLMGFYHDSDMATVDAIQSSTYSVSANDASSVLLCLNTAFTNVTPKGNEDGIAAGAQTDCYRIDASGKAALASVEMTVGGEVLTFK